MMGLVIVLVAGVLCGATVGAFFALTHDLPQIRSLETYRPSSVTRIYSNDNVLLTELFEERRDPVPLEQIPEYLKRALLTMEDRKFYSHIGIDLKGIVRATVRNIIKRRYSEGASTLTQQLAKTLFLTPRKTLTRKIREAILSLQLERRYTKDEILELYLNQVYFGSGAYGVESAARTFFGKPVTDLTLAQCALIAAMPRLPSRYSPIVNKELAIRRRNLVLRQMLAVGIITDAQYRDALAESVDPPPRTDREAKAPYFVQYITGSLVDTLGAALVYKGGLTIRTTLDYRMQKAAELAIENRLNELESRMKQNGYTGPAPQATLIAIDVATGEIRAMVGGRSYTDSPFNRALDALRQPGSAFKPVIYAQALSRGYTQNMTLLDAPVAFKGAGKGRDWTPRNFSNTYKGEMTLRRALAISGNIPAVRLMDKLGPESVARFAKRLGITSDLSPHLSLALGTSEVTLLELTAAYAVFPNKGKRISPVAVKSVADHQGRLVFRPAPETGIALSRTDAAIITDMLQAVVLEGTGKTAQRLNRPVAGKTGTTDNYKDALFVGFSPTLAAGVWVGLDQPASLGRGETGARAALPIWIDFMNQALKNSPRRYFDIPDDTVYVWIDPATGNIVSDSAPGAVKALLKRN